jgi:hypothetical protein
MGIGISLEPVPPPLLLRYRAENLKRPGPVADLRANQSTSKTTKTLSWIWPRHDEGAA